MGTHVLSGCKKFPVVVLYVYGRGIENYSIVRRIRLWEAPICLKLFYMIKIIKCSKLFISHVRFGGVQRMVWEVHWWTQQDWTSAQQPTFGHVQLVPEHVQIGRQTWTNKAPGHHSSNHASVSINITNIYIFSIYYLPSKPCFIKTQPSFILTKTMWYP